MDAGGSGATWSDSGGGAGWSVLEALEPRLLLSATVTSPFGDVMANKNQAAITVDLAGHFDDPALAGTVVQMNTVLGAIPIQLFDVATDTRSAAPLTVTNFLHYVNGDAAYGTYANSIVHRSDPGGLDLGVPPELRGGFVIQGGGFSYINENFDTVYQNGSGPTQPTVASEYSVDRSNVRGTVAMALTSAGPDSGTDQWFINLGDNSGSLDPQSFTVFGQVVGTGMDVVDAISALPSYNASSINSAFDQMPLRDVQDGQQSIEPQNVVLISSVTIGKVVYTVATDTPDLLNVTIENGHLTINAAANQAGSGHVTVTATDVNGQSVQSTFLVTIQDSVNPPTIGSLTATPNPVNRGVQSLTITAGNVVAPAATVAKVEFFIDSNGNGTFQPGTDAKLGEDTSADGGWTYVTSTSGWPVGAIKLFARAQDSNNVGSSPLSFTVTGGNAAPTLTTMDTLVATSRSASWSIAYSNLTDYGNEADANGDALQFRIEAVTSGTLKKNGVAVIAGSTLIGPGDSVTWTAPNSTTYVYNCFTVRAWDGHLASATPVQVKIQVNRVPVVTSLTLAPTIIAMPGSTATFTVAASDPDDYVATVELYYDSTHDGVLEQDTDTYVGAFTQTSATGWKFVAGPSATAAFATGGATFFAVAFDSYNATALKALATTVNTPPTITSLLLTNPAFRGGTMTLTATGVHDTAPGTITKVAFYRDDNGNGVVDVSDKLLGNGTLMAGMMAYKLSASTVGYALGSTQFIAQVTDNNGGTATVAATTTVRNAPPTITSLSAGYTPLSQPGATLTLTAMPKDVDGTVTRVDFYYKPAGSDAADPATDFLIGSATTGTVYGWKLVSANTAGFATGAARYYAVATDSNGDTSAPLMINATVNPPPTIASLVLTDPAYRGTTMTLTAMNVLDTAPGTITKVVFYRDANGNGIVDAADKLLGYGVLQAATHNYKLTASTVGYALGATQFIAQATDNNGGITTSLATATLVNSPPAIASMSAGYTPLSQPGATLTLNAVCKDVDGAVTWVDFYYMPAGSDAPNPAADIRIGWAATGTVYGWKLVSANTAGFATGAARYYAVATDSNGGTSAPLMINATVNTPPTIGSLVLTDPAYRGTTMTLTAMNVLDTAPGTIAKVAFYRDDNGNGVVDAADKSLGLGVLQAATHNYKLTASTVGYALGATQFIAQASDNNGGIVTSAATATVVNSPPTIGLLTRSLASVARGAPLTLTAYTVADKDGTIAKVEFYSLAGTGAFDSFTATKIGEDASAVGGWSLAYTVPAASTLGTTQFFARATDNNGAVSAAVASLATTVTNVLPTIAGFAVTTPVTQPADITLTAAGVANTDGDGLVQRVRFYEDVNKNNLVDAPDRLLGTDTDASDGFSLATASSNVAYAGSVRFLAVADDNDGGTSAVKYALATVNPFVGIDLVGTALAYTPATVNRHAAGQSVRVTGTVRNQGSQAAGAFSVSVILRDSVTAAEYTIGSISVAGLASLTNLAINKTISVTTPTNLPPEGWYYVVLRADAGGQVSEVNELNNDFVSPLADFSITA